jgi:hypothetical protein
MKIEAYRVNPEAMEIRPCRRSSEWLKSNHGIRCLPMRIASQIGWEVISPCDFTVVWNGEDKTNSMRITQHNGDKPLLADNNTGYGILNIPFGYIFRTPENVSMWIKGPANTPKFGASPLEGVVETYWLPFSFSINWKITRVNCPIQFLKDEALAQFFPIRIEDYEDIEPVMDKLSNNPELQKQYEIWSEHREEFFNGPYLDPMTKSKDRYHRGYHDGISIPGISAPRKHWGKVKMQNWKQKDEFEVG